ncbi:unnamed protein product, partial [Rotaria magnacalcarata]
MLVLLMLPWAHELPDWVFGWPDQFDEKVETTTVSGRQISPCLSSGSIIYVRSWVIGEFLKNVYPYLENSFVLITGEGDLSFPSHLKYLDGPDSKIIHWFGQNVQYDLSAVKKFTHIPVGINCYEMSAAIRAINAQQFNQPSSQMFDDIDEPLRFIQLFDVSHRIQNEIKLQAITTEKLVLIYFDMTTDGTVLLWQIWKEMCEINGSFPFVECFSKPNNEDIAALPTVYARHRRYPFWLSLH